jgi:uncharacterized protein DUF4333
MTHPWYGDDDREAARPVVPPAGAGWGPPDPAQRHPQPGERPGSYPGGPYGPSGAPQFGPPSGYGWSSGQWGGPDRAPEEPYGQPPFWGPGPYGSPGDWGPPPPPARRRRRRVPLLLGLLGVVLLATAVVWLTTATQSSALDPQAVEQDVARQFQQQDGVAVDLTCNDRMTVTPGRTYRCSGTTADGNPVTITIRITDSDAHYTWSAD